MKIFSFGRLGGYGGGLGGLGGYGGGYGQQQQLSQSGASSSATSGTQNVQQGGKVEKFNLNLKFLIEIIFNAILIYFNFQRKVTKEAFQLELENK